MAKTTAPADPDPIVDDLPPAPEPPSPTFPTLDPIGAAAARIDEADVDTLRAIARAAAELFRAGVPAQTEPQLAAVGALSTLIFG